MMINRWVVLAILAVGGLMLTGVGHAHDCSNAPQYVDGNSYDTGAIVRNGGHAYECTVGGWCGIGGPYAPGVGWAWPNAWNDLGTCNSDPGGGNDPGSGGDPDAPVKLYQDCNYSGAWEADFGTGSFDLNAIVARGGVNDDASSIRIAPGYKVVLYYDDGYRGRTVTLTGDTSCFTHVDFNDVLSSMVVSTTTGDGGKSINSIPVSDFPAPVGEGVMTFHVMNATGNAYSDDRIYWGVLGINPVNGKWSYLGSDGRLLPISNALNNASGHLTKDGQNYANIYHKLSESSWNSMPLITSGRMYICVGSPCYIKTYDNGFAGPNIDNPTDPNLDVYWDFIEFTVDNAGFHGNTTRVDMFGIPLELRLVNGSGSYDRTVGEKESESRSAIFAEFKNEVPQAFKSLATVQAPYRIVAPIHGSFAAGGANANYFAGYSSYSTQEILLCNGTLVDAQICAAINRHVYDSSNWNDVNHFYWTGPANYYAKFWHDHDVDHLAYGFAYDDVYGRASYLEVGDPKGFILRVGWNAGE